MNLAPPVQEFLNAGPKEPLDFLTVDEQRQMMRHLSDLNYLRFGARPEPVATVRDFAVPVEGGQITVRAYWPSQHPRLPAHLQLHGGGWWLGSIDEKVNDAVCRYRCVHADCVIFAVEYRLAPEHRYPTAIHDIYAVLLWIADNARLLGIDPENISIGGTSAGANLAAAVTLYARDSASPRLVFQLLEVPGLDLTGASLRAELADEELSPGSGLLAEFSVGVQFYLHDFAQATLPLVSPIWAADLSGLPPAHIMTAELDPLRAEGERYARLLISAGVQATVRRHPGAIHATNYLTRAWQPAQEWQWKAAAALRAAHWQDGQTGRPPTASLPGTK